MSTPLAGHTRLKPPLACFTSVCYGLFFTCFFFPEIVGHKLDFAAPLTSYFLAYFSLSTHISCHFLSFGNIKPVGDFKNNASISLINVYRLSKADL